MLETVPPALARRARVAACLALAAGTVGLSAGCVATVRADAAEAEVQTMEAEALEAEVKALSEKEAEVTPGQVKATMRRSAEAGRAVADLQNAYMGLPAEKVEAHAESVGAYLAEGSSSARVPWFSPTVEGKGATWEFVPALDFGEAGQEVLWLCRADDDRSRVLAWAEGVFDPTTGLFSKVSWEVLPAAAPYMATEAPAADAVLDETVKTIAETAGEPGGMAMSDMDQIAAAREALKAEQEAEQA